MRRRTKLNINPKYVLIACGVICIGLIVISFRLDDEINPIKSAVSSTITPMQQGINTVGTFITDRLDNLKNINDLLDENEQLKEQVTLLTYENKLLIQDKYELDGLRELYELDQKYLDYPKVAARIIGKDPSNWYNVFTIDKGTRDGITEDMNILAGNGLVGIVVKSYYNHSIVRAIIDDNSNVAGMFLKTSDLCNVKGDLKLMDSGKIRVELISKDADISDGDEVYTAHTSDKFLQGILIGYVSDIELDSSNMTKTAYLTPVVDFDHLEEVLIITQLQEPLIKDDPNLQTQSQVGTVDEETVDEGTTE